MTEDQWLTKDLPSAFDYLAPDGSEIRLLLSFARGGLAHCTLPENTTSAPVRHRTVEEIWYFLEGSGEVRRRRGKDETVTEVFPGRCLAIPTGIEFQIRNIGQVPLRFLIATMPQWPGTEEAGPAEGHCIRARLAPNASPRSFPP